jgi:hypothetical protein
MAKMSERSNGEWLVPFQGRNRSGAFRQNFLWRKENVYVMDNHRAALWCWLQHIDPKLPHSLLHIDQHYDALMSRLETWLAHLPENWDLGIDEYLSRTVKHRDIPEPLPLFGWDNYLSIYLALYKDSLRGCRFATHREGTKPDCEFMECEVWDLPLNLDFWLEDALKPWIVNLDLDYFFWQGGDDEQAQRMLSKSFINNVMKKASAKLADGTIGVLTIALSPEYCGGWKQSEEVLDFVLAPLGIPFSLPGSAGA